MGVIGSSWFFSPPFHYWRWAEGTGRSHECFVYFSTASMELLYLCSFRHVCSSSICYAQVSRLSVCSRTAHTHDCKAGRSVGRQSLGKKFGRDHFREASLEQKCMVESGSVSFGLLDCMSPDRVNNARIPWRTPAALLQHSFSSFVVLFVVNVNVANAKVCVFYWCFSIT